jgi:hypothetical protein
MQYENSNDPAKAIKHYNQGMALGDSASNYVSNHPSSIMLGELFFANTDVSVLE